MMWLKISACFLAVSALLAPSLAAVCPDSCICETTRDSLHRATCSNLAELYKFTLRQKHHNINILDLSHNNISKLNHELDRLTEVVTLDLSTNGIQYLNKFLHNSKKLVHLNLANNRIQDLSLSYLPASVSSLDLTNNLLKDVPLNLAHLVSLEHLEMEGNPLNCSCENILARDRLLIGNVLIDNVECAFPDKQRGKSWLQLKTKEICKVPKTELNYLDMMMGDQPLDALKVGEETSALKSIPLVASNDLEDGNVIHGSSNVEDDDRHLFLNVKHSTPLQNGGIEGSGEYESTTVSNIYIEPKILLNPDENFTTTEEPFEGTQTTADSVEGSGEGSGFSFTVSDYDFGHDALKETTTEISTELSPEATGKIFYNDASQSTTKFLSTEPPTIDSEEGSGTMLWSSDYDTWHDFVEETTTEAFKELTPGPIVRVIDDDVGESSTEFMLPEPPSVYKGGANWNSETSPSKTTEKQATSPTPRDTTVSEKIRVTYASEVLTPVSNENVAPHKTGTYVCIAIIVILLVGLIGFAIIKGQMRKRRDRRLLRQQKRDVEKASKEMVDMNKSLLGKPALLDEPIEKKVNGKYELVPTHETHQKKGENGDVSNGIGQNETNKRNESPRDSNQNKSSSKDNNLTENDITPHESSFESAATPDSRKDSNSLASEDIFVPINESDSKLNGTVDSVCSQQPINGDQNTDSDFLSPSREYVPVYSPDMGRVRIKMSETPKPKTPVLVTRSRSNAGDIIIIPSRDANARKSTT